MNFIYLAQEYTKRRQTVRVTELSGVTMFVLSFANVGLDYNNNRNTPKIYDMPVIAGKNINE